MPSLHNIVVIHALFGQFVTITTLEVCECRFQDPYVLSTHIFLIPCGDKFVPWAFYKPNVDKPIPFENGEAFCCILCHFLLFWVAML
jgi:hypothetical protein